MWKTAKRYESATAQNVNYIQEKVNVKVSLYTPEQALRVPGA